MAITLPATPYYTSTDLLNAIKRKISFPVYQSTFSDNDLLAFANEEMMISQVPSILQYHEEYFVFYRDIPLNYAVSRYPVPSRAIGMKLRDATYMDTNGNLFEMTRIMPGDKTYFNRNISNSTNVHKFYMEGNEIVLTPVITSPPSGQLRIFFFLRPNQLVVNSRAAIIQNFNQTLSIIDNSTLVVESSNFTLQGQSFVPVASITGTNQFLIGVDATATALNIANSINASTLSNNYLATANMGVVSILSSQFIINLQFSDIVSYSQPLTQEFVCTDVIPANITAGSLVDLLQTNPGHRTYDYDIKLPAGGVSGNSIFINQSDLFHIDPTNAASVPLPMVVGDYVSTANECIIPQIPPDLHNGLAERACARVLEALGDQQGLQNIMSKMQDIQLREGNLLDDRVEGSALKVGARHSLLRYLGVGSRRRL